MPQILEWIFVLLVVCQCTHGMLSTEFYDEKATVHLSCDPPSKGSTISWFRVREDGVEFLAAFYSNGDLVRDSKLNSPFSAEKIKQNTLTLNGFQNARDNGTYSCSSFNKNKMHFGKATRIQGKPATPTIKTAAATTAAPPRPSESTCTSPPCNCQGPTNGKNLDPSMHCDLLILAPLAGGCGLIIIILIITVCYCNRMRTKRCPHHYKRPPKKSAPVRQASPDRYV
ncbi:hypothetical protein GJAV_G00049250 [Gymnothorax javanicus]|nr:hypothetical protein GJAV_G00049250 [Gymnothorax javanicus]